MYPFMCTQPIYRLKREESPTPPWCITWSYFIIISMSWSTQVVSNVLLFFAIEFQKPVNPNRVFPQQQLFLQAQETPSLRWKLVVEWSPGVRPIGTTVVSFGERCWLSKRSLAFSGVLDLSLFKEVVILHGLFIPEFHVWWKMHEHATFCGWVFTQNQCIYSLETNRGQNSMSNQTWETHRRISSRWVPWWLESLNMNKFPWSCHLVGHFVGELYKVNTAVCAVFWQCFETYISLMFLYQCYSNTTKTMVGLFASNHHFSGDLVIFLGGNMSNMCFVDTPLCVVTFGVWPCIFVSHRGHLVRLVESPRRSGGEMIVTWGPDTDEEEDSAWPCFSRSNPWKTEDVASDATQQRILILVKG